MIKNIVFQKTFTIIGMKESMQYTNTSIMLIVILILAFIITISLMIPLLKDRKEKETKETLSVLFLFSLSCIFFLIIVFSFGKEKIDNTIDKSYIEINR